MIYLAAFGMLCPLISWLTAAMSWWTRWRYGRNRSAVLIPFIGPICLTGWVLLKGWSAWLIPAIWLLDLGTLAFVVASPGLFREWWRTSRFTKLQTLRGRQGIESAILTLHSGGHYLLLKSWSRPPGSFGVVELGEPGTYIEIDGGFELTAHFGLRRILRTTENSTPLRAFSVSETPPADGAMHDNSLDGWTLTV